MARQLAIVHFKSEVERETIALFCHEIANVELEWNHPNTLRITEVDQVASLDFHQLSEWLVSEMFIDHTLFLFHAIDLKMIDLLEEHISWFDPGVYDLADVIIFSVSRRMDAFTIKLHKQITQLVGEETMRTVYEFMQAELNQTQAAKQLYMHRNTLLYRLDHFKRITLIDVSKFRGAFAIRLLHL